ncbi:protein sly1 homolog isoform X4 [Schistocerca nitens]|uniref:protein sly1 homolog isoform X3 n=1 Tax=Schistocerca nitens TaxID=7011 RepID=UPI002118FE9D|nr:protein sly1 homolog isoform X3 [Schistocerca nitens]XP_049789908.1 protein sly1 homolog isoform X4 [Schistocerca nitens]
MLTLREKQIGALKQMLNLNQPHSKTQSAEPVFKILIYDRCGQDIISPLVSIKELRELGVTLHVQLHSDRDPIPDVPAVYFCLPTEENLGRISQDFQNNLYDAYHLNFISPISRQKLEDLASAALQANCVSQIQKVYDQYLNFISLEDDMFILKHQNSDSVSYYAINRGEIKDTEMESIMDSVVDSLFSVFATLGAVPIIRSPRGNAAEMVAEKLDKKLRENLRDTRNSLFIMDATQTGHFSPFPIVAEAIQEELEQYRSSEDEVKKLKESMGIDNESDAAFSMVSDNTAKLTSAVNSLPQLMEKKRLIDMHTTIATAILNCIKSRRLDTFFEFEEKIMSKTTLDRSIMELLADGEAGTPEDKLRLFLIYYICSHSMSEAEYDRFAVALQNAGCDLQPLSYIKRWKAYTKMAATHNQYVGGGTKTVSMFSKLVSQGSSFVMEGVKNLVVKRHNLPVTRLVDELMEMKTSQETEDFRYFDPKQLRPLDSSQIPRNRMPFQEAIVFVVGGGNYIEYQNLVDYTKGKAGGPTSKRVTYGSTTLSNAKQFLKQLSLLGQEIH